MRTVTLPVKGLNFAGCAREIEKHLGKQEPIKQVEASYISQMVTISYDETKLNETQLREMVKNCGFACGEPLTTFTVPGTTVPQPTKAPEAQPVMAHPAIEHRAHVEAPAKMDMGGMDHDMSDPAMARAMEADMRNRFFVSLLLTIPVILYSPLGALSLWYSTRTRSWRAGHERQFDYRCDQCRVTQECGKEVEEIAGVECRA